VLVLRVHLAGEEERDAGALRDFDRAVRSLFGCHTSEEEQVTAVSVADDEAVGIDTVVNRARDAHTVRVRALGMRDCDDGGVL
jgi:hypothetical protein